MKIRENENKVYCLVKNDLYSPRVFMNIAWKVELKTKLGNLRDKESQK